VPPADRGERESRAGARARPGLGWPDFVVALAVVGLLTTVASLGRAMWAPFTPEAPPAFDLSPSRLPGYAARSLARMFLALGASFAFTCVVASGAAKSRRAARVILPALDILQSVPVLGFLSATVTFFVGLTPGRALGLELASIFAIFTSQVWNLTFAFYHSLVTLPREPAEATRLYRLSAWQRFTHFELPAAAIPLVWNGMMSFGGGWFFLAASEAITVLDRTLLLPGVGSYLAVAAQRQDLRALGGAVVTLAVLVLGVDRLFWRPLVAWAEKFKLETSPAERRPRSAVLTVLRRSHVVPWAEARLAWLDERVDRLWRRCVPEPQGIADPRRERLKDRLLTLLLWGGILVLAIRGAVFVGLEVGAHEALRVLGLGALTLLRVAGVLGISGLLWTPVGVWIGLNPGVAQIAQPLAQWLASFPANALFPLVTLALLRFDWSVEWAAAGLMLLGAQWYVLFNTIAGATAIPTDLRDMTRNLGIRGWTRWRALILPGIFPGWVTGALTATGGAWNASIVAEVVQWGDVRLTATGLGAYIAAATTTGDWPRIVLGVAVMSAYVVALNRLVWQPLGELAARRFAPD
jgi:NitT/TauT family transport system permease protein